MSLAPQQFAALSDRMNRDLGRILIDRVEGDLVFGQFSPGPDFAAVEKLFLDYVEAGNDQILGLVGELDATITALGLELRSPSERDFPTIYDVQIGSGTINFRMRTHGQNGPGRQQGRVTTRGES